MKRKQSDAASSEASKEIKKKKIVEKSQSDMVSKKKRGKYEKPLVKTEKSSKSNSVKKVGANNAKEKHKIVGNKNSTEMEKPDWMEIKKQKKELKEKRRAKKLTNVYDISVNAKQISEKLRRSDCSLEERNQMISEIHGLMKSQYNKVIFTHDLSRIIQWVLKYCEPEIRQTIVSELKPSLVSMLQAKYAKNCLKMMLKYGTKEIRSEIISACYGNIVKLMSHSVSFPMLELIYSTWATETEKMYFKQEFYGDMYKQAKDKNLKVLSDVYKTAKEMKAATLSAVKGNLLRILNKKLLHSTLVQTVLSEFMSDCSVEDRNEMIVMLRSSMVELSRTKIGAKIAATCVWHGTNKDRKIIMKALKDNVKDISMSEHGYLILLALFDSVDDTVLMKKIILPEIQKDLMEIVLNEYGKHVILYLIARRNSHYFPPSIVEFLKQGDNNEASKKPSEIREKELLEAIIDCLLEAVSKDAAVWMSNSSIAMVTLAILKVGSSEKLKQAFEAIAAFITNSKSRSKEGEVEFVPVEHAGLHMMLKKLIQNDKDLKEKNEGTFGEVLICHLTAKVIQRWIEFNRACFLLIFLLESETETTVNNVLSKLKPLVNIVKSKSSPGAKILLKKLNQV